MSERTRVPCLLTDAYLEGRWYGDRDDPRDTGHAVARCTCGWESDVRDVHSHIRAIRDHYGVSGGQAIDMATGGDHDLVATPEKLQRVPVTESDGGDR